MSRTRVGVLISKAPQNGGATSDWSTAAPRSTQSIKGPQVSEKKMLTLWWHPQVDRLGKKRTIGHLPRVTKISHSEKNLLIGHIIKAHSFCRSTSAYFRYINIKNALYECDILHPGLIRRQFSSQALVLGPEVRLKKETCLESGNSMVILIMVPWALLSYIKETTTRSVSCTRHIQSHLKGMGPPELESNL